MRYIELVTAFTIVIEINAKVSATLFDSPNSSNTGDTYLPSRSEPSAADKKPRKVIPT